MNRWMICVLALIILGCEKKSTNSSVNKEAKDCQPFFTFDRLDHFQIDIADDSILYFQGETRQTPLTALECRLSDLLLSDSSMSISDTTRLSDLEMLGYSWRTVDVAEFDEINQLFCEGLLLEEIQRNLCLPVFRDILVFRKGMRITGFAKLCFSCDQSVIVGTDKETHQFGQAGEFQKIASVLNIDLMDY